MRTASTPSASGPAEQLTAASGRAQARAWDAEIVVADAVGGWPHSRRTADAESQRGVHEEDCGKAAVRPVMRHAREGS